MLLTYYYSFEVEEVCLHIAMNNSLRLLPVPIMYFFQFLRCFCESQNSKEQHSWNDNYFGVSN